MKNATLCTPPPPTATLPYNSKSFNMIKITWLNKTDLEGNFISLTIYLYYFFNYLFHFYNIKKYIKNEDM